MAGFICTPFKVHQQVQLPAPPDISVPRTLPKDWEKTTSEKIGGISTQNDFPKIYENWLKRHPRDLTETERYVWLNCLLFYTSIDTNRNGIPDWSALLDQQPAKNLFPEDPDQDGDGILNVFDPQPLVKTAPRTESAEIPIHLKIDAQKRPEAHFLQDSLYKEFRILAVDHTDEHSPGVLRELLFLLRKGFAKKLITGLKTIKYVYAFAGHNHAGNIASYHWQAQALSVGGMSSYPNEELNPQTKIDMLSALSHEIGHAVLFEKLCANDLADVSHRFSDWSAVKNSQMNNSFFSPVFFEPFPLKQGRNIVSQYALVNRHEWFAESMAASVLNNLGKSGELHENWRHALIRNPLNSPQYWVDYTKISDDFRHWFKILMKN